MYDTRQNVACLDGSKLQYPLLLRKWKHGDTFRPLGMKHMKKVSDFFIDAKLSLIEKERCWVLVSGGQIAWIAGWRIDDRFKITDKTTKVVKFSVVPTVKT
jgi:tRNA(Ile)-lysidine synthase